MNNLAWNCVGNRKQTDETADLSLISNLNDTFRSVKCFNLSDA